MNTNLKKLSSFLLLACVFLISHHANSTSLESGMCIPGNLSYLKPTDYYEFYATANDTVIIRFCNTAINYYPDVDFFLSKMEQDVSGSFVAVDPPIHTQKIDGAATIKVSVAANGWYQIKLYEDFNDALGYSYNISMLRMPGYPLSFDDLDVGPIEEGEYLPGYLDAGDLDAAMFPVTNNCLVQIRMGQKDPSLVPNLSLYDPYGQLVLSDYPPEYRAEITSYLTTPGIYTAVLRDNHDNAGNYYVSMLRLPPSGDTLFGDLDIGPIVHGETVYGKVDVPGDLDLAWFPGVKDDQVQITMTKLISDFNPKIEVYGPDLVLIASTSDWFQVAAQADITCHMDGLYYIICKDTEGRYGDYKLNIELLGGPSTNNRPDIPIRISATDGAYSDHIRVSWEASAGANSYEVWRYFGTNDIHHITNTVAPTTVFDDYAAPSNTLCFYKIRAKNSYGTSDFSESDSGYYGTIVEASKYNAVLVGINNYAPASGATQLYGCSNDVVLITENLLLSDSSNRWEEANIKTLFDSQATKSVIRGTLQGLAASAEPGSTIFYQQSSHGGTYGGTDTFLHMFDAHYTDAELASDLARFKDDVTVILLIDACHSGGLFKGTDGSVTWPFVEQVMSHYNVIKSRRLKAMGETVPKTLGSNIGFMVSAAYDQTCWDASFNGKFNGVFTYFIGQACTNTLTDTNLDGELQCSELFNYAAPKASAINPSQTAQTFNDELLKKTAMRSAPI
ncbi:MAG: hypothetical protein GX811_03145, partial [Lentisphaerae bacterium]|nr:hypothetical protein [Lentisphaerota bacterium]